MTDNEYSRTGNALRRLFSRKPVAYYPELARALESVSAAILLQEICHWGQFSENGWVFRTRDEIEAATALKRRPQESSRRLLRDLGILEEKREGIPARLYYRVDYDRLTELLSRHDSAQPVGTDEPNSSGADVPYNYTGKYTGKDSLNDSSYDESASAESKDPAPPVKAMSMGQFYNKELAERITYWRERGKTIHSPTDHERKDFGAMFKQAEADGYDIDVMVKAIEYQVEKAAGMIEGEKAAWCGYRTALDRVALHGWSAAGDAPQTQAEQDRVKRVEEFRAETLRLMAEAMQGKEV